MKFFVTATAAIACLSSLVAAAPVLEARQRPRAAVYTKCVKPKTVALTFDDGPWVYMYDISKALIAAGGVGTFFVNGNNYECIYNENGKRLKYLFDKGHQIASHTWSHKDLTTLSWDKIHDEMWKVEQAMKRILGVTPAMMRPPYGNYNNLVREAAYARGQSVVNWDFDSGDSTGSSATQSKNAYKALFDKNPNNVLALNHETYSSTAHDVLPYAINLIKQKGYKMVTVAECLGLPAYASTGQPESPSSSWKC